MRYSYDGSYEERLINRVKNCHDVKKNAKAWIERKKEVF